MSRYAAFTLGLALGMATMMAAAVIEKRDQAERTQRHIEAQASYTLGRAYEMQKHKEGEATADDAGGADERRDNTAARA